MHTLVVPKTNNNDDSFVLLEWLLEDGAPVAAEQLVATVETSKATIDFHSEVAGILQRVVVAGTRCAFGTAIGYVFPSETARQAFLADPGSAPAAALTDFTITKVAQAMMDQHGLSVADLAGLGKKLIKKSDIEELLGRQTNGANGATDTLTLSPRQITIAETVSRSHAAIPRAFLAMKVTCDAALAALSELSTQEAGMIGLTELLVKIVAGLRPQFPFCFGRLVDQTRFEPAAVAHVGVTLDIGKGLFVPVVRDAATRSLPDIADTLMDFRIKALRNAFKETDLTGGNISISLNTEEDIVFVLPIILPDQTCMLSLNAVTTEPVLLPDQTITTRRSVILGLAYDHRVINGYEAVQFVKAIKAQIEAPAPVLTPS